MLTISYVTGPNRTTDVTAVEASYVTLGTNTKPPHLPLTLVHRVEEDHCREIQKSVTTGKAACRGHASVYLRFDQGRLRHQRTEQNPQPPVGEASSVIKQKEENYVRSLSLKFKRNAVFQETYATFYPDQLYQTYTAAEPGSVEANYESRTHVVRERKSRTSYLEPPDRSAFHVVLNPAGLEPVVQYTLYLKVRYSLSP